MQEDTSMTIIPKSYFQEADIKLEEKQVNDAKVVYKTKKGVETEEDIKAKKAAQRKRSFNGLTATEWASMSKNVWNDLSSPRNKYQLEHGAVFPVKLAERLIKMYSRKGDAIFDPFLGIGTTMIAAQNLERHCIGTELNPHFADIAKKWTEDNLGMFGNANKLHYKIVNDDCRHLEKYIRKDKIQLTVTSPPYADFIQKSLKDRKTVHKKTLIKHANNSTVKQYSKDERDFGNLPYQDFLEEIKVILKANYEITKKNGYSAWVVKDYRDTKNKIPYVPFHSDLARAGEEVGFKYHDLIVWDQTGQRRLVLLGYPFTFYTNQNCSFIVIFRKS